MGKRPDPMNMKTVRIYKEDPANVPSKESLNYEVLRTSQSGWLPVYRDYKGEKKVETIIRRIKGDVNALAKDLEIVTPAQNIRIHPTSKNIILTGDYLYDVRDFLTLRKF
ncbi:hypothetical protein HDU76_013730 [Blyttiomyces sp. JEL0837]|nr:hypothetical protein HDU76_013730 [Blyttiomyces sp. JEL0837]